jgi:putative SOS response-associated peptidase YedK
MGDRYSNVKTMNQLGGVRESTPNLDVRPTNQVPFLQGRLGEDGTVRRELSVGRWGMIPTFAKAFESKFATFNARSDDVGDKPTFRNAVPRWRAAVPDKPVSSYYEWKKSGPKRTDPKQRYKIAPDGSDTIAFAGLYAPWRNAAVEDESHPDAWLLSCIILTMPAPPHQSNFAVCHSDHHHRWAGPPRNQGATRRSRFNVSFGAPPSLIYSRNIEPLPVPQVALRTLKPSGDSVTERHTNLTDTSGGRQGPTTSSKTPVPPA